jgi:alpha-galactosidase
MIRFSGFTQIISLSLALLFGMVCQAVLCTDDTTELLLKDCYAHLRGDTLRMGNELIERIYAWNEGNLISLALTDKKNQYTIGFADRLPDLLLPGESIEGKSSHYSRREVASSARLKKHLELTVISSLGEVEVKRIFRIFPETPAIQCTCCFRGKASSHWVRELAKVGDLDNLEHLSHDEDLLSFAPVMERIELPGVHWKVRSVEFYDMTDRYNNLVKESEDLVYRFNSHRGNVLMATDQVNHRYLFILKESPSFYSQQHYPGADFISRTGQIEVVGIGVDSLSLSTGEWIRGYGFVTGFGGNSEYECLSALRSYQKNIFPSYREVEPILMVNTWGDRSQDTKIGEQFLQEEIDACRRFGANYLQIDDGWQLGRSTNSAFGGGTLADIWDIPGYWTPHPGKFPDGFGPVLEHAAKKDIRISLWYNPCATDSYQNWQNEFETLSGFYQDWGIRTVKIDGLKFPDKASELRVRKIFDSILVHTDGKMILNLDVTAHRRHGYHYFNEYGVFWVNNRYTDWKNYYPYTVLRNTWMLSKYIPPEKLQMPFLNIWRNQAKYGENDPFAPSRVPFDYAFAVTMAAQPMAFFECSSLPEEAFLIRETVGSYLKIQEELHSGIILPIGDEPSGSSWTGFQSVMNNKEGFLLIFRERNDQENRTLKTWLKQGKPLNFKRIIGKGTIIDQVTGHYGTLLITMPSENSWGLFRYTINH